jgi:hypothetical protein
MDFLNIALNCPGLIMVFETWDLNFGAWEILGYGFQDMVFKIET